MADQTCIIINIDDRRRTHSQLTVSLVLDVTSSLEAQRPSSLMAQSYFSAPARSSSSLAKEPLLSNHGGEKHLKVEDVQEAYIEQKDRFVWNLSLRLLF